MNADVMAAGLSSQFIESLTPGRIVILFILFSIASFIVDFTWHPRYPKSLPRLGSNDGYLGTIKNWFQYGTHFNDWVAEGTKKYGKHGRAFVVPAAPARPDEIVVPRSQTAWFLELPDRVLSTKEAHRDALFNDYQFFGEDDQFPIQTIHKHLARNIISLLPALQDEIHGAIEATFANVTEEDWTSINLWEALLGIIPRVTNSIIVGAPLCRNDEFLKNQVAFADDVVRNSFILMMIPSIFHPIVGPLVALSNRLHWRRSYAVAQSTIEKRLQDMMRSDGCEPPEDMLTWLIRQAKLDNLTHELDPVKLSKRLLPVQFAAIHTTVITAHNLVLDLLTSDPSQHYLKIIHDETSRAFREANGNWTKNSLTSLYRTDSAIKESMRLSHFATSLTHRKVIAPEGVTNTVEGWHAPYGASLMIDLGNTHHDGDLYPNPDTFDAFRFSRIREEYESREQKDDPEEAMRIMRLGMVTTSDSYLPFSHGRHACPGRFFVAHELKMILAYLLNNFEIKPVAERPKPMWLGQTIIPPVQANIEVKRRRKGGD
ncbi:Ent-kaurene oxidase [Cladorrhinum sp. PSN332]|nr:Ent-kaurene oxidase [Cladorrhinum sp. PSN332]